VRAGHKSIAIVASRTRAKAFGLYYVARRNKPVLSTHLPQFQCFEKRFDGEHPVIRNLFVPTSKEDVHEW